MNGLWHLAWASAWHRRFVLSITLASVALSALLLASIEQIRADVREGFSQSVSGTDLIVGPRTGSTQLLLYSVFRIGQPTNNMRWDSVEALAAHRAVRWVVPISLGDSHRGFPVVGTSTAYFDHMHYGDDQPLVLAQGGRFDKLFDAVIGSEVARQLGYQVGAPIVLSHGDGAFDANDHADKPFKVVGILAPTGTPVDRSVHISLQAMQALHVDWVGGAPMPGIHVGIDQLTPELLRPTEVTAVLVGLKSRTAVFAVQRWLAEYDKEPLMAILPGVALDELWQVVGSAEKALLAITALVAVVSFSGLVATMLAGLSERRRELAILRAVGASPRTVLGLLLLEGTALSAVGVLLGWLASWATLLASQDWAQARWGLHVQAGGPTHNQVLLMLGLMAAGLLASVLPAWRAYRLSLADGLSPKA
ncbi:MAG: ABC transporter permease [Pseudomonadota bacterium]